MSQSAISYNLTLIIRLRYIKKAVTFVTAFNYLPDFLSSSFVLTIYLAQIASIERKNVTR